MLFWNEDGIVICVLLNVPISFLAAFVEQDIFQVSSRDLKECLLFANMIPKYCRTCLERASGQVMAVRLCRGQSECCLAVACLSHENHGSARDFGY
jgi:hypothetical protein